MDHLLLLLLLQWKRWKETSGAATHWSAHARAACKHMDACNHSGSPRAAVALFPARPRASSQTNLLHVGARGRRDAQLPVLLVSVVQHAHHDFQHVGALQQVAVCVRERLYSLRRERESG